MRPTIDADYRLKLSGLEKRALVLMLLQTVSKNVYQGCRSCMTTDTATVSRAKIVEGEGIATNYKRPP